VPFTTEIVVAVPHGALQFRGVGTPPDEDGSADLQYVWAAARSIGEHMTDDEVVVDRSTVPVGTADAASAWTVIRGQYIYLGVLLADSRRIVARGRRGREDFRLTVSSNRPMNRAPTA
jgi:UDP-N-acetyl-D-mannosaminuronate dehydrogenase